ncbi:MAG: bifunctional phosphoribosylaminoimidazolecarboxamide formyltransferase/IMP cyclohydrolase [Actinomycetota bacterium]
MKVRRALVSVADKTGLVDLARALRELGVDIVSSGSTAGVIRDAALEVTAVADVTGHPEILGGRVKTLHPKIHGGILADRRDPEHIRQLEELGIEPFDLVVVTLYPFREAVASGASPDEIVEQIDIGGPTLVRAAAKNFESVGVVVSPARYAEVVEELRAGGELSRETRRALAAEAFREIAAYDEAIASWFAAGDPAELPALLFTALEKIEDLRYGENPHQRAALYRLPGGPGPLHGARVLQGKAMSFNNWLDAEAALSLAASLPSPAAVIVKHNNPCGVAVAPSLEEAYRRAFASDTVSAFGGVVAVNAALDDAAAAAIGEVFTEVVVAPSFSEGALSLFGEKKNLRLLEAQVGPSSMPDVRLLPGGALVQDNDAVTEGRSDMKVVSSRDPSVEEWRDLVFAWVVAARVKSNAIVLARDGATVGVGAGQMSRVDSVEIAAKKAGDRSRGSVMASDAFFPFRDGVDAAGAAGVTAVIQPGGSVRDDEVLAAAEEHGMAMVLTGRRHFRH